MAEIRQSNNLYLKLTSICSSCPCCAAFYNAFQGTIIPRDYSRVWRSEFSNCSSRLCSGLVGKPNRAIRKSHWLKESIDANSPKLVPSPLVDLSVVDMVSRYLVGWVTFTRSCTAVFFVKEQWESWSVTKGPSRPQSGRSPETKRRLPKRWW